MTVLALLVYLMLWSTVLRALRRPQPPGEQHLLELAAVALLIIGLVALVEATGALR